MKLHELQEKRSQAVTAMRALADQVEGENRDYSADEETRHADLKKQITALDSKIQRAKDVADAERSVPAVIQGNGKDGAYEDRARDFSITKAISARLGDDVDASFEKEISQEVTRRSGRKFQGIAVPDEAFFAEKRTLTTTGAAADLVPNVHRGDLFIDRLRSALVTGRLGATVLDNLVGDVDIPRQTGSSTAQWVAEDGSLTETDADFDDVKLAPKTVGAITSFSRRTLINSVPAIENLVRNDLSSVIANAIDFQAMLGTGAGNTPTGVANVVGVNSATLATPSWAEVLAFIASIEMQDADIGSLGWAMNPNAVAKLRSTNKVELEPQHGFLMMEPGNLAGYAAATTSAIPSETGPATSVLFGAWSQLLIGYWSGTDILVNPYEAAAYAAGRVKVRVMRDVDVKVRHAESFSVATDLAA